jgi:hypothetical protein
MSEMERIRPMMMLMIRKTQDEIGFIIIISIATASCSGTVSLWICNTLCRVTLLDFGMAYLA